MDSEANERLTQLEERVSALERALNAGSKTIFKTAKKTSIREFLDSIGPGTQTDMVICMGYYLETYEGLSSFSVKELLACFMKAREKSPTNVNALINHNISKGTMMLSDKKEGKHNKYTLTNTGVKYVEGVMKK